MNKELVYFHYINVSCRYCSLIHWGCRDAYTANEGQCDELVSVNSDAG